MKRIAISLVVLAIAAIASFNPDVPKEYGSQWLGFAGMVIAFYLGSKTTRDAQQG
ncbi:MAG TPA: hypothetical protein PK659_09055 [Methanothrix sp.]|nr:hypothetical protein [Methanothrix sp.]HOL44385.1 hypothetical protein [Methanothrix sp.]